LLHIFSSYNPVARTHLQATARKFFSESRPVSLFGIDVGYELCFSFLPIPIRRVESKYANEDAEEDSNKDRNNKNSLALTLKSHVR
jgi:hypothetical protein